MGIFDKAKELAEQHPEQVDQAIDKVGDVIDEKTGNKYASQVDMAQEKAKEALRPDTPVAEPEAPQAQ